MTNTSKNNRGYFNVEAVQGLLPGAGFTSNCKQASTDVRSLGLYAIRARMLDCNMTGLGA